LDGWIIAQEIIFTLNTPPFVAGSRVTQSELLSEHYHIKFLLPKNGVTKWLQILRDRGLVMKAFNFQDYYSLQYKGHIIDRQVPSDSQRSKASVAAVAITFAPPSSSRQNKVRCRRFHRAHLTSYTPPPFIISSQQDPIQFEATSKGL
jgi:hypothetical protein